MTPRPPSAALAWLVAAVGVVLVVGGGVAAWRADGELRRVRAWGDEDLVRGAVDFGAVGVTDLPVVIGAEPAARSPALVPAVDGDPLVRSPLWDVRGTARLLGPGGREVSSDTIEPGTKFFGVRGVPLANLNPEHAPPGPCTLRIEVATPAPDAGVREVFASYRVYEMVFIEPLFTRLFGGIVAGVGGVLLASVLGVLLWRAWRGKVAA